jgi:hypothetical protein
MRILRSLTLLFLFVPVFSQAADGLTLKGGLNVAWTKLSGLNSSVEHGPTAGFNTHFEYRKNHWSLDLSSYINFSGFTDLDLKAQGIELSQVDGDVRNLSIAPLFKYHCDYEVKPAWNLYFGFGPTWSLLTMKLDDDITGKGFGEEDKFVYESQGASIVIGMEEKTLYKEMHPVYFEFMFQYLKSYELTTVDARNTAETIIVSKEEIRQIESLYYIISMGITIF